MSRFKGEDAARLNDPESWDEDDIRYLRDRDMLPDDFRLPTKLQAAAPAPRSIEDTPHLGDVGLLRDADPTNPSIEDPDPVLEADDVDEMKKPQLMREAATRGLDTGGTVAELRERIREFDARTP